MPNMPSGLWKSLFLLVSMGVAPTVMPGKFGLTFFGPLKPGISLCGLIVDIQKAFNFLPRVVVMESCALLGIPFGVIRGWAGALSAMARRFLLNVVVSLHRHLATVACLKVVLGHVLA